MKVLYVTKQLPFGATEAFIFPELKSHQEAGWQISLCPLSRGPLVHAEAKCWLDNTLPAALFSIEIVAAWLLTLLTRPKIFVKTFRLCLAARTNALRARNLAVWPKGLWLAGEARRLGVDHIHAHWIAAPATMAIIAARVARLPLSITAHRYDIAQGNLIAEKFAYAKFVRAIDERGAQELRELARPARPIVLHMGVQVPSQPAPLPATVSNSLNAMIGARLTEKKGVGTLIDAIAKAKRQGVEVHLTVFGDGPLLASLQAKAVNLGIADLISWHGVASHDTLLEAMLSGRFDIAVLPSETAADGDKEGIPVFLMEAMAAGLPIVTTLNGGIGELSEGNCAVTVSERDPDALADAFIRLAASPEERQRLASAGRAKIQQEFEIGSCMAQLRELISS